MTFATDISDFVRRTNVRADQVVRKLTLDLLADVQFRSPVDTGRYRGSHRVSINRVDPSVEPPGESIPNPGPGAALQPLASFRFGGTVHLSNNLPYAVPLEMGHSGQAPQGVYGLAFQAMLARFARTVAEVRRVT